ncbi:hypothetical protein LEP1GSC133_4376 [Leptospira borgpetersenii serovar Pomona str. 200901868]|uniref:Uncharacterized protein n=1 Tax=Leptospira borgpetersenii serovar Pomona str. 200901868 TaxID=1192866 RepID=M6VZE8_LEPBO|nr:hypothetical protein LEP1GSC133_4376 [Leptospira borgpetersenii serovar Pomona str. 200901868]
MIYWRYPTKFKGDYKFYIWSLSQNTLAGHSNENNGDRKPK